MTTSTLPTRRRILSAGVGLALAAGAVAAALAIARRSNEPPARPAPGDVVLETTVDLARGASDRRLLAPGPCVFDVEVSAPVGVRVTFGPPAPSTSATEGTAGAEGAAEAEGGPAPETSTEVAGHVNGSTTDRVLVYAAGIQVLRVEPVDPKAGGKAVIRVRRRPRT